MGKYRLLPEIDMTWVDILDSKIRCPRRSKILAFIPWPKDWQSGETVLLGISRDATGCKEESFSVMVTPRTGRPTGRPKKSADLAAENRHVRAAGRPSVPFLDDPDRYLVALMRATMTCQNLKQKYAAELIAALQVGREIAGPEDVPAALRGEYSSIRQNCPSGLVVIAFGPAHGEKPNATVNNTHSKARAGSIVGRSKTILQKAREFSNDATKLFWLNMMAECFSYTLGPVAHIRLCQSRARTLGMIIGESSFVETDIIPRITGKNAT